MVRWGSSREELAELKKTPLFAKEAIKGELAIPKDVFESGKDGRFPEDLFSLRGGTQTN